MWNICHWTALLYHLTLPKLPPLYNPFDKTSVLIWHASNRVCNSDFSWMDKWTRNLFLWWLYLKPFLFVASMWIDCWKLSHTIAKFKFQLRSWVIIYVFLINIYFNLWPLKWNGQFVNLKQLPRQGVGVLLMSEISSDIAWYRLTECHFFVVKDGITQCL